MKLVLSIVITSIVFVYCAQAQNFEIIDSNSSIKGSIGEELNAPIKIRNNSGRPLQLVIKRIDKVIGTSQENYFCWGEECYGKDTDQIPLSKRIGPGQTSSEFNSILRAGLVAGYSTVKYLIYNRDNPAESIEYEVSYLVEDDSGKKVIFNSKDIVIKDIYPNPVSDFAIIDYNIFNDNISAKILIHNVLGSVVGKYELPALETKIKINTDEFNPGVYFYTLYIDNDGVLTQKIMCRK